MEHRFNTDIAKKYGIEEAILLNNLYYWIAKNKANNCNMHEQRYWTFNSNKAFAELFDYITESKIYRALKHLVDEGIIIKGNFNKEKYDRTNWYAFSDYGYDILDLYGYKSSILQNEEWITAKCKMHSAKMKNGFCQNEETIPNNKQQINKPNNKQDTQGDFCDAEVIDELDFKNIWAAYQVGNPAQGKIEWEKLTTNEQWEVVNHLKSYLILREKKFRKNIENYLKEKYWNTKIEDYEKQWNNTSKQQFTTEADKRRAEREAFKKQLLGVLQQPNANEV